MNAETILEPGDYGDIVVDSVTVLNGPITCDNMVIRRGATLKTNGFRYLVRETVEFLGTIELGDGKKVFIQYND